MKFEKTYRIDSDDEDNKVDLEDIFKLRKTFARNSTTKGAMREPLRTITGQANMNKYLDLDSDDPKPVGPYLECKMVGDKYVCPYCTKDVSHSQGIKKGYTRHLGNKTCMKAREAADKVASSNSASGGGPSGGGGGVDDEGSDDEDSSDQNDEDTYMTGENDAGDGPGDAEDVADSRPLKRSRK